MADEEASSSATRDPIVIEVKRCVLADENVNSKCAKFASHRSKFDSRYQLLSKTLAASLGLAHLAGKEICGSCSSLHLRFHSPSPSPSPSPISSPARAPKSKEMLLFDISPKRVRVDFDDLASRTSVIARNKASGAYIQAALSRISEMGYSGAVLENVTISTKKHRITYDFRDQPSIPSSISDEENDDINWDSDADVLSHRMFAPSVSLENQHTAFLTARVMDETNMTRRSYRALAKVQSIIPDYLVQTAKFKMEDEMSKVIPIVSLESLLHPMCSSCNCSCSCSSSCFNCSFCSCQASASASKSVPASATATATATASASVPTASASDEIDLDEIESDFLSSISSAPTRIDGYCRSIKKLIAHLITKDQFDMLFADIPIELRELRLKFGGDGRQVGRKVNHILCAIQILGLASSDKSPSALHTIVIAAGRESETILEQMLAQVTEELEDLQAHGITLFDQQIGVSVRMVTDWKFAYLILGLMAPNASYFCLWCDCCAEERENVELNWKIRDEGTIPRGFKRKPIIKMKYSHVLIDLLHLLLRMFDLLFKCFIEEAINEESSKCNKCFTQCEKLCTCSCHVKTLELLVAQAKSLGVNLAFWRKANQTLDDHDDHEGGTLRWTSLMGPDKKKLLRQLSFEGILSPIRAKMTRHLWDLFLRCYDLANEDRILSKSEIALVKQHADEFCRFFVKKPSGEKDSDNYEEGMYPNVRPTPYMHALQFHLTESLESAAEWGCSLNQLSTQSIEYKNFEQNAFYFRNSRRGGGVQHESALSELMRRENRLLYRIEDIVELVTIRTHILRQDF